MPDLESELLLLFLRNLSDTCRLRFLTHGLTELPFSGGLCVKVQKFVAVNQYRKSTGYNWFAWRRHIKEPENYLFIHPVNTLLV